MSSDAEGRHDGQTGGVGTSARGVYCMDNQIRAEDRKAARWISQCLHNERSIKAWRGTPHRRNAALVTISHCR